MDKNRRTKKNNSRTKFKYNSRTKLQCGGKFLGEGSYGCVVTPAIPCNKSNSISNPSLNKSLKQSVSKIIIAPTETDKDEITISNKLKRLDPKQIYFITFEDACYIKQIPNERSNTVKVEYNNDLLESYDILDKKKYDKDYCPIDLRLKPINLIMPYGGYDLMTILDKKQTKPHIILTRQMLFNNFKSCFKILINGIKLMHDARIVNRDIKKENIMVNYNMVNYNIQKQVPLKPLTTLKPLKPNKNNNIEIRYIDFGLSSILTNEYCKRISNIDMRGTIGLISPELIIAYYINDNETYDKIKTIKTIINKELKPVLDSLKDSSITMNFDNKNLELYQKIQKEFNNRDILQKFFGTEKDKDKYNGYLQKGDVFALGITMYEFLTYYKADFKNNKLYSSSNSSSNSSSLNNPTLIKLLQNMIKINPEERYNILQCLNDPFYT